MSQTITLYVDGACRGNPGLGGWGAYIISETEQHKLCGGEPETTNNRMELTAAIEGIAFCSPEDKLIIWTDSNYVKRGITEWIEGWKKKNWKDVKNPDLWKKLDSICQGREIEWNWIKGHAGHAGNEMADQLANQGADETLAKIKNTTQTPAPSMADPKKKEDDWLLNDPFGLGFADDDDSENETLLEAENIDAQDAEASLEVENTVFEQDLAQEQHFDPENEPRTQEEDPTPMTHAQSNVHPAIVITPQTIETYGPRQLILDTETTGFYYQDSDRIIEVGAIEMINRKLTGSSIHIYINPEKEVGDSVEVHGITDDFLKDKPKYQEIAQDLFEYLKGSEIIAHNASFDMNFLDMEFKRAGLPALSEVCEVTDTLALAKSKHPGQKNSLDALVRRYEIVQRDRTFHGALLDAEILSDVYLAMTGGQVSFDIDALSQSSDESHSQNIRQAIQIDLPVILPSPEELEAHENWVKKFAEKHGEPCIFAK